MCVLYPAAIRRVLVVISGAMEVPAPTGRIPVELRAASRHRALRATFGISGALVPCSWAIRGGCVTEDF
jgi:hypothetical protein